MKESSRSSDNETHIIQTHKEIYIMIELHNLSIKKSSQLSATFVSIDINVEMFHLDLSWRTNLSKYLNK